MTTRDTRASELAAAQWNDEGTIAELKRHPDGTVDLLTTTGIGFFIESKYAAQPMEVGEQVAIAGHLGAPIQGIRVGGRLVFFKTQADLEADRQKFLDDLREKREAEYRENQERWRAELAGLPLPLRERMERFVSEAGGFEPFFKDAGAYELFCCTEATKFAEYFRRVFTEKSITTPEAADPELQRFRALSTAEQKALVAYDSGHSGNTFGGAVVLGARVALGMEV
jgi:hypothetical protein